MIKLASCVLLVLPAMARAQQAPEPAFTSVQGAFFAVSVRDLDASIGWYSEKLGLKLVSRFPKQGKIAGAILAGGGLEVELLAHDDAAPPPSGADMSTKVLTLGLMKVGVRVTDFDGTIALLRQRGVSIPIGPFPPRRDQRANAIILDNAGNLIQVFGDFAR